MNIPSTVSFDKVYIGSISSFLTRTAHRRPKSVRDCLTYDVSAGSKVDNLWRFLR